MIAEIAEYRTLTALTLNSHVSTLISQLSCLNSLQEHYVSSCVPCLPLDGKDASSHWEDFKVSRYG